MAVGIIVIGCFYLVSPERISGAFGLKPPAADADTRAWLRPKGIRDVATHLALTSPILRAMPTKETEAVSIFLYQILAPRVVSLAVRLLIRCTQEGMAECRQSRKHRFSQTWIRTLGLSTGFATPIFPAMPWTAKTSSRTSCINSGSPIHSSRENRNSPLGFTKSR